MYEYEYPRPMLTADIIVFAFDKYPKSGVHRNQWLNWHVLLIKRANDPFKDHWALPGGFVNENEASHTAARRELKEETSLNLDKEPCNHVGAFDEPDRDPRGWVVSVAHYFIVDPLYKKEAKAADDAKELKWFPMTTSGEGASPDIHTSNDTVILPGFFNPEKLAFDHREMIWQAIYAIDKREFV